MQDPDGDARSVGDYQGDKMQSHKHTDSGHRHDFWVTVIFLTPAVVEDRITLLVLRKELQRSQLLT